MRAVVLIVNRLIWFAPTVLGLMVLTFIISHVIPADPIAYIAGENASNADLAELRKQFGLDLPVHIQLYNYVIGVMQGDFGVSLYTHRPISDDLFGRLPATLDGVVALLEFHDCFHHY